MKVTSASVPQAAVMIATLLCLTLLAMFDKLLPGVAGAIFSGIAGVVFGAAGATVAANGAAHAAVTAALDSTAAPEVKAHHTATREKGR